MSNKTAEGLRDRLFGALDGIIDGTVDIKKVEAICYTSEQILKSAQIEIDIMRERTRGEELANQHAIQMKREERESIKMLGNTIEAIEIGED